MEVEYLGEDVDLYNDKDENVEMQMFTFNKDIDLKILSELNDRELFNICVSSPKNKYLKSLCGNETFWRNRLYSKFPEFENTDNKRNWKKTYLQLVYYDDKYTPNEAIDILAQKGMKNIDLIKYFIFKGADAWNIAMAGAAFAGDKELVDFFIQKGADNWDFGMELAAEAGHEDLVKFFIFKGAIDANHGLFGAAKGGHKKLVDLFIKGGATNLGGALLAAERGGHKEMIRYIENLIKNQKRYV